MDESIKLLGPLNLAPEGDHGIQGLHAQEVVVLAPNFKLTGPQHSLLSRGLTFIPTIHINKFQKEQFQLDLQNYHRKIKLATYYKNSNNKDKLPFVGPSTWAPPLHLLPEEVGRLIQEDDKLIKKHYKTIDEKPNISFEESQALKELKNARHIVIKPADKGSAVVIMGRDQYILEVERQLNDSTYYKKLSKPIYMETIPMVTEIVNSLKKKKIINAKQKQFLMGEGEPRARRFYILPKIHKDPESWTVPFKMPPGRPIVSDCGSETYGTAEFLDFFLNPLSNKHPSYIRDTYHFIELVKNITVPLEFFFFSMDVASLYTNIPIKEGINCVKNIFNTYPDPHRPDEEILKLLDINLTRNDFVFDNKFYLQIKGTAMGKKFAPAYANIYMANWESEVFLKCHKKPIHYLRYLDDIWGIWDGSEKEFWEFVDILNGHNTSIQLKTTIDRKSIDFLDTTVFKGPNFGETLKLDVKVFFKNTDTHALLHKDSFHPKHTFRGIVKSQLLRFKRICTTDVHFKEAVATLFKALRCRGYSRSFLRHCLKTFLARHQRDDGNFIPLITVFSSIGQFLNGKIKNNFSTFIGNTEILPSHRVISAFKRNKNLKDFLVQAKLPNLIREKPQKLEAQFSKLKFIKNKTEKTIFSIKQNFTTRSKNCVYVIFCSKCGIKYVGETKNTLSTRMMQHRYNIKNKKETETPLVRHFLDHGLEAVRMAGLEKNVNWSDGDRKKKERRWIFLLGTREPAGLNIKN